MKIMKNLLNAISIAIFSSSIAYAQEELRLLVGV
jgi:hypothetical protein